MNPDTISQETRKKAYSSYHEDGIIDILIASYILMIGIILLFNAPWLAPFAAVLYIGVYRELKRKFTVPRSGFLKFGQNRLMIAVYFLAIVLSLPLLILPFLRSEAFALLRHVTINYSLLLGGLIGTVVFSVAALTFRVNRFHIYGLITLAVFAVGYLLDLPATALVFGLSATILCYGAVKLNTFIKKY